MATAEALVTPEEYLALERASHDRKSEFINGRIYAMAGASRPHNKIVLNIGAELRARFRGGPCEALVNDMRVKASPTGAYTYPDVVAVCGKPELEDAYFDTLLNPVAIIEVLSPSTERHDRGDKWAHYRTIETLRAYVLVAQDGARVEMFELRGEEWIYSEVAGADAVLQIEALGVSLPLADVYEGVEHAAAA